MIFDSLFSNRSTLAAARRRAMLGSARWRLLAILALGAFQGLFYLWAMPPWQHYDEPSHFEYAWLLAHDGRDDPAAIIHIRREIAASMAAHGFYGANAAPPLAQVIEPSLGYSQFNDPPLYYLAASLPLRLLGHQDLAVQLYAARLVSLACFLATLGVAAGLVRELTGPDHPLRWAVPLCLACLPPFIDVMTAVNNDAGATLVCSLFWWGAVRVLRRGLNGRRLAWLAAAAVAAALTKNTALLAPVLLPWLLIYAVVQRFPGDWRRGADAGEAPRRRWGRAWPVAGYALAGVAALAALALWGLRWHDAAFWYRVGSPNAAPTRAAIDGGYALALAIDTETPTVLAQPLLPASVAPLRGRTITVGAWVWADRPALVNGPGLALGDNALRVVMPTYRPLTLTTTPTWHSWTTAVPTDTSQMLLFFSGLTADRAAAGGRMFVRAPALVAGDAAARPPADYPPTNAEAVALLWAGSPNLLRNPGASQRWPQFNPALNRLVSEVMPGSPQNLLSSLMDSERTHSLIWRMLGRQLPGDFFLVLAWGGLRIGGATQSPAGSALLLAQLVWLIALAGCCRWLIVRRSLPRGVALLGLVGALGVIIAVLRAVPLLQTATYTSVRYAYPVAIPLALALVGGWTSIAPRRFRGLGLAVFLAGLTLLNLAAWATVLEFQRAFA